MSYTFPWFSINFFSQIFFHLFLIEATESLPLHYCYMTPLYIYIYIITCKLLLQKKKKAWFYWCFDFRYCFFFFSYILGSWRLGNYMSSLQTKSIEMLLVTATILPIHKKNYKEKNLVIERKERDVIKFFLVRWF